MKARLVELLQEINGINWDITGLGKVRKPGEGYLLFNEGHALCYRGQPEKHEYGVGFLVHKDIAGNIE